MKFSTRRETQGSTGDLLGGLTFDSFGIEMIPEPRGSQVPIRSHNKTIIGIILNMIISSP
jgi:hypothetical protein